MYSPWLYASKLDISGTCQEDVIKIKKLKHTHIRLYIFSDMVGSNLDWGFLREFTRQNQSRRRIKIGKWLIQKEWY